MFIVLLDELFFFGFFLDKITLTNTAQRKALLGTITRGQIKAFSQIAHNIIKFWITLTPSEKVLLNRYRRLLYILGDMTLGYVKKIKALHGKQKFVYSLLKIALTRLEFGARIMEKLVLVTHDKYQ